MYLIIVLHVQLDAGYGRALAPARAAAQDALLVAPDFGKARFPIGHRAQLAEHCDSSLAPLAVSVSSDKGV